MQTPDVPHTSAPDEPLLEDPLVQLARIVSEGNRLPAPPRSADTPERAPANPPQPLPADVGLSLEAELMAELRSTVESEPYMAVIPPASPVQADTVQADPVPAPPPASLHQDPRQPDQLPQEPLPQEPLPEPSIPEQSGSPQQIDQSLDPIYTQPTPAYDQPPVTYEDPPTVYVEHPAYDELPIEAVSPYSPAQPDYEEPVVYDEIANYQDQIDPAGADLAGPVMEPQIVGSGADLLQQDPTESVQMDGADGRYYEPPEATYGGDPAIAAAALEADPLAADDNVLPPHAVEELAAAPRGHARNGLVVAAGVFGIVLLGGAGIYAFRTLTGSQLSGPPPVIAADLNPVKIAATPPAADGPQGKLIYDRVGGRDGEPVGEKMMAPGEEPVRTISMAKKKAEDGSAGAPVARSSTPVAPPVNAPRKVRTVVVRPDGTIISSPEQIEKPAPPAELPPRRVTTTKVFPSDPSDVATRGTIDGATGGTAVRSGDRTPAPRPQSRPVEIAAADPSKTVPVTTDTGPATKRVKNTQRVSSTPKPERGGNAPLTLLPGSEAAPAAATSPATRTAAAAPVRQPARRSAPVTTDIPRGGYLVQVSSQRSAAQAHTAFSTLQRKYAGVLGSRQPLISRADLGDRGIYYRVLLGPMQRAQADRLCSQLKSEGGNCFVKRN